MGEGRERAVQIMHLTQRRSPSSKSQLCHSNVRFKAGRRRMVWGGGGNKEVGIATDSESQSKSTTARSKELACFVPLFQSLTSPKMQREGVHYRSIYSTVNKQSEQTCSLKMKSFWWPSMQAPSLVAILSLHNAPSGKGHARERIQ